MYIITYICVCVCVAIYTPMQEYIIPSTVLIYSVL